MMKHFLILLFFISFTSNALAFPVAESISLYSIFSYWFFSLFAGGSIFLNKNNKYKVYRFLSIFITVLFIGFILLSNYNRKININTVINSISINFNYLKANPYLLNEKENLEVEDYVYYVKGLNIELFEDFSLYLKNNKPTNFIYLKEEQDISTSNPLKNIVFKYNNHLDDDALFNFVKNYNGDFKIYASSPIKSAHVSLKIFKQTGKIIPIIIKSSELISDVISYSAITDPLLNKKIDEKSIERASWNEKDLVDVSSYYEVLERHTVVQAELFPIENIWMMTDIEVIQWLENNKNKKFISVNRNNLIMLENRLQRLNIDLNSYGYKYIPSFYSNNNQGYPITPYFFNNGSIYETDVLRDEMLKTDDIQILCFDFDKCKMRFPTERFDVIGMNPFEVNFQEELNKLDKTKKYVAAIDNRQEYGWAIKYGYWMNTNPNYSNFLGFYYLPQRFDYYEWLKYNLDNEHVLKGTSFYESVYKFMNGLLEINKQTPENVLTKFLIFGAVIKFMIIGLFGWMYFARSKKLNVAYSLINVGFLISFIYSLSWILTRYDLIPFFWYSSAPYNSLIIYSIFIAILSLSCLIKTGSHKITALISVTLIGMYITGYLFSINVAITMFIIGMEFINIMFELFYIKKNKSRFEKYGLYSSNDALNNSLLETKNFPEKWLLVNKYKGTEGYLVDLSKDIDKQARLIIKLFKKKIIIRSCASTSLEQNLAGYYESIIG